MVVLFGAYQSRSMLDKLNFQKSEDLEIMPFAILGQILYSPKNAIGWSADKQFDL